MHHVTGWESHTVQFHNSFKCVSKTFITLVWLGAHYCYCKARQRWQVRCLIHTLAFEKRQKEEKKRLVLICIFSNPQVWSHPMPESLTVFQTSALPGLLLLALCLCGVAVVSWTFRAGAVEDEIVRGHNTGLYIVCLRALKSVHLEGCEHMRRLCSRHVLFFVCAFVFPAWSWAGSQVLLSLVLQRKPEVELACSQGTVERKVTIAQASSSETGKYSPRPGFPSYR